MQILKSLYRWPVGLLRISMSIVKLDPPSPQVKVGQIKDLHSMEVDEGYIPNNTNPNEGWLWSTIEL